MPDSSTPSAPARLIEIRASRWLRIWWLAVDLLLALSAFMVSAPAGIVVAALLGLLALRRRQSTPIVISVTADGHFALPNENRSDLTLTPLSRSGPGWLQLSFSDHPGRRLLLLRDQVDDGAWREFRIRILESR